MSDSEAKMIRALIIDDESLARDVIRHMLQKHADIQIINEYSNGAQALPAIREEQPDLIFIDIEMPRMNGIELAKCLEESPAPIVVFVTAYSKFAVEAFEQNAFDYLLKPFDQERFDQMIRRVRNQIGQQNEADLARQLKAILSQASPLATPNESPRGNKDTNPLDRIIVKDGGRVLFIDPTQVRYFEASGNYVALHLSGKTHLLHETLNKMEQRLASSQYLRIHRSTIVNLNFLKELQPHFNGEYIVILNDETRLKMSRTYSSKARIRLRLD
ncbi:MAG: response regulator transcription factor [Verrucomicrobia bacterium]|jgi:two-component system, LytTR family, response regulator|nr:response regulator transcription factor [Verrucomicrobiota bacterium]